MIDYAHPIPVFPLPRCVLLPGGTLPLHIFEPRYRAMTEHMLSRRRPNRVIAMAVVPESGVIALATNHAPILPIVCIGEMMHHQREADGRYHLLLQGLQRARVRVETSRRPFRLGVLEEVTVLNDLTPLDEEGLRRNLVGWLRVIFSGDLWDESLPEAMLRSELSLEMVIDLAANLVIPVEDWALRSLFLQAESLGQRMELLLTEIGRRLREHDRSDDKGENGDDTDSHWRGPA